MSHLPDERAGMERPAPGLLLTLKSWLHSGLG